MNTKLIINLGEGTVHVEGSEDFVRFIYDDFKTSLSKHTLLRTIPPTPPAEASGESPLITSEGGEQSTKPAARKRASSSNGEKARSTQAKPTYNSKLDLTTLGKFYDEWKPKNVPEKILVFATFLRDCLCIKPCSANDIYTCFFTMREKTKIPEAFSQAFTNTKVRTHYIEFETLDSIEITIAGTNWFTEQAKKLKEATK